MKNGICLNMIVRDESRVILRCLESVKPYIDSWAIVDTGSEDETMDIVRKAMEDIPGELYQEEWVNFGHNRDLAFQHAKKHGDYALIIDADDIFTAVPSFSWPEEMSRSHYEMDINLNNSSYAQARVLKTECDWKWVGAVHEHPEMDDSKADIPAQKIIGAKVVSMPDGKRRLMDPKKKFLADAAMLKEDLKKNPEDSRSVFYLAQSYRDAGENVLAIDKYRKRSKMGGWPEEVWYSLYQIGVIHDRISNQREESLEEFIEGPTINAHLAAYRYRPSRIEPLVSLGRSLRMRGDYHLAYTFLSRVARAPRPNDRLFMDKSHYDWFALDEYAVCCYHLGMHEEAIKANVELLERIPLRSVERIRENIRFSRIKSGIR